MDTDAAVLNFMKDNRIASLFVPAKCTDEIQECDVIINKPYKDGVRQAFRDHVDDNFQKLCDNGLLVGLTSSRACGMGTKNYNGKFKTFHN